MKKTINLYEAAVLDEMFENHHSIIYHKFPVNVSWELHQFSDIIKQIKHLWTETVTARIPSELMKSINPKDMDVTMAMMDDIADQKLTIIVPDYNVLVIGQSVLSDKEFELFRPLWDLVSSKPDVC